MAELPAWLQVHTITVETRLGATGGGTLFAPPVTIGCWVDDETRLVRDSNGAQVVSSATLYTSDPRELWAPGSRITVNGRQATVITAAHVSDAGLGGWQHTEVTLT